MQYPDPLPRTAQPRPALTQREQDVLHLMARGFSYGEIARLLQVSVHTTRSHAKNLYVKLNVHSKNEAVFEAISLGLLDPATWGTPRPDDMPRIVVRTPSPNED